MEKPQEHARIFLHPRIWITAEHMAEVLGVSVEKADQLLSRPETTDLLKRVLSETLQSALLNCLHQMARVPHERMPVRRDCAVELPALPVALTLPGE